MTLFTPGMSVQLLETSLPEPFALPGDDVDVHICTKCKLSFYDIQDYLEHKIKHDNMCVRYKPYRHDKRTRIPNLIHKGPLKASNILLSNQPADTPQDATSESVHEADSAPRRRGRPKGSTSESVDTSLIVETRTYTCLKCSKTFKRAATLRRHIEVSHNSDSESDDDDDIKPITNEGPGKETSLDHHDVDFQPNYREQSREKSSAASALLPDGEAEQSGSSAQLPDQVDQLEVVPKVVDIADMMANNTDAQRQWQCDLCCGRFKEKSVLKAHLLTHTQVREFKCPYDNCHFAFKTRGSLKRHIRRHTGERPFECTLCTRHFTESGALTRHLRSRTPCTAKTDLNLPRYGSKWDSDHQNHVTQMERQQADVVDDEVVSDATNEPNQEETLQVASDVSIVSPMQDPSVSYTCKVCEALFNKMELIQLHLRIHLADYTIHCAKCHFVAENKQQFITHQNAQHSIPHSVFQRLCSGNESSNNAESSADQQLMDAHVAIQQIVSLQNIFSPESGQKQIHKRTRCPVCLKSFSSSTYHRLHMKAHTGERAFPCQYCEKTFVSKDALSKHLNSHRQNRQYKCGQCGKLFSRMAHVYVHLKRHSMEKPYFCSLCNKQFKSQNSMKVHARIHTNIRPYVCRYCHQAFREKGSLHRHIRTHTGDRPYKCGFCGKTFRENSTMSRHLKAKVPCTRELGLLLDKESDNEATLSSVLTEFSSVVADTQNYIIADGLGDDLPQVESHITEDQIQLTEEQPMLESECMLLEEDLNTSSVEIVTVTEEGEICSEAPDKQYVLQEIDGQVHVIDSQTGLVVAHVPIEMLRVEGSDTNNIAIEEVVLDGGDNTVSLALAQMSHETDLSPAVETIAIAADGSEVTLLANACSTVAVPPSDAEFTTVSHDINNTTPLENIVIETQQEEVNEQTVSMSPEIVFLVHDDGETSPLQQGLAIGTAIETVDEFGNGVSYMSNQVIMHQQQHIQLGE